ncbi:MAG: hypothetical protein KDD92_20315 [Caldilineaceae bacterium]|nr:hypothetical protein [Caldilineaceae bacterium]
MNQLMKLRQLMIIPAFVALLFLAHGALSDSSVAFGQECVGGELVGNFYSPEQNLTALTVFVFNDRLYIGGSSPDLHSIPLTSSEGTIPLMPDPTEIMVDGLVTNLFVTDMGIFASVESVESNSHEFRVYSLNGNALVKSLTFDKPIHDIYVAGNYAYLANGVDGLQVVELTGEPTLKDPIVLAGNAKAMAISVRGDKAYVVAESDGNDLWVFDVSTPDSPALSGSYDIAGANVQDIFLTSTHILVAANGDGLLVLKQDSPSTIVGALDGIGRATKVHAIDDGFAYVGLATDGVMGVNLSESTQPTAWGCYSNDNDDVSNLFAYGDHVFVAYDDLGVATLQFPIYSLLLPLVKNNLIVDSDPQVPALENGGFEPPEENNVVWQQRTEPMAENGEDPLAPLIVTSDDVQPNWDAHNGTTGLAWLGGFNDQPVISEISQDIRVDSRNQGVTNLEFYYAVGSNEPSCAGKPDDENGDLVQVLVDEISVWNFPLCTGNTRGWTRAQIPIDGNWQINPSRTVTLKFRVTQDSSENSNFYLDDVSFCSDDLDVVNGSTCQ